MVWKPYYEMPALNWFFRLAKAIPVGTSGPRDVVASISAARKELEDGHVVCIFAEGAISRTGNMLPFRRGPGKDRGRDGRPGDPGASGPDVGQHLQLRAREISCGSGRKRVPYPVTVSFGAPMPSHRARRTKCARRSWNSASDAAAYSKSAGDLLDLRFIRTARKNWRKFAMADSSGRELTYGRALAGSLLVSRWVQEESRGRRNDRAAAAVLRRRSAGERWRRAGRARFR